MIGCLEAGYYGADCSTPCPDPHCRYCHIESGNCQGCEPGYKGHNCELGNLLYSEFIYANNEYFFYLIYHTLVGVL